MSPNSGNKNVGIGDTDDDPLTLNRVPEFEAFISFSRKHLGLLAAIALFPVVSGFFGVLPNPVDTSSPGKSALKLEVVSGFLSLITFANCFLLAPWLNPYRPSESGDDELGNARHANCFLLARWLNLCRRSESGDDKLGNGVQQMAESGKGKKVKNRSNNPIPRWWRAPFVSVVAAMVGVVLVATYPHAEADWHRVILYLATYQSFMASLGVLFVAFFAKSEAFAVQNDLDRASPEERSRILDTLRWYVGYLQIARGNTKFKDIGMEQLGPFSAMLKRLATGRLEARGDQVPEMQRMLFRHYTKSCAAVADRDLEFWAPTEKNPIAAEYLKVNYDAEKRGIAISRIFLCSRDVDKKRRNMLVTVLETQHVHKLGWAVAIMDEIDSEVFNDPDGWHDLTPDFAIATDDEGRRAVSFFEPHRGRRRDWSAVCGETSKRNQKKVDTFVKLYQDLIPYCRIANEKFIDNLNIVISDDDERDIVYRKVKNEATRRCELLNNRSPKKPARQVRSNEPCPIQYLVKSKEKRDKIEQHVRELVADIKTIDGRLPPTGSKARKS